jgi:hypothetical protein
MPGIERIIAEFVISLRIRYCQKRYRMIIHQSLPLLDKLFESVILTRVLLATFHSTELPVAFHLILRT